MIQKNWQELIKPTTLSVDHIVPGFKSTIVVEPLERGFGTTLGNALRRILLSSLRGGAVTSVKIDGVLHEFSTIPGVVEDVVDIILNVKELALAIHSDGEKTLVIDVDKEGVVTAADIKTDADVEILNPMHAFLLVTISIVLRLIGGAIPARMASRRDPVIALRTE